LINQEVAMRISQDDAYRLSMELMWPSLLIALLVAIEVLLVASIFWPSVVRLYDYLSDRVQPITKAKKDVTSWN
jgi:hypothetical protein